MKILFLDIDGVMNSGQFVHSFGVRGNTDHNAIDPAAVIRLNKIIVGAGALVVISSSWRLIEPIPMIELALKHHGFMGYVIGSTTSCRASDSSRGDEIGIWLKAVKHERTVESFVILDDDDDMDKLSDHLVKTTWENGLQDEHVDLAIKMLNR